MKLWDRFKTAFALLVIVAFCIAIADMFFSFDAVQWLGSPMFALPVLAVVWLVAPAVNRALQWKKGET